MFTRICDLQDENAIFGADLFYHKPCMTSYLQKLERYNGKPPEPNYKQQAWRDIVSDIEKGLHAGNGYEVSAIRDRLNRLVDDEHQLRNRDVKILLLRQFSNSIDFTYPNDLRESMLFFGVPCNSTDALAERIRLIPYKYVPMC